MPASRPAQNRDVPAQARRGTLRSAPEDVLERVEQVRAAEGGRLGPALLALLKDVILLLRDLARSPAVPWRAKILAGAAAAYLFSPLDVIPDWLPVIGQADDVAVAVTAVRRVLQIAGYEVIYDLWRGSDEGLALVLTLAGVEK